MDCRGRGGTRRCWPTWRMEKNGESDDDDDGKKDVRVGRVPRRGAFEDGVRRRRGARDGGRGPEQGCRVGVTRVAGRAGDGVCCGMDYVKVDEDLAAASGLHRLCTRCPTLPAEWSTGGRHPT